MKQLIIDGIIHCSWTGPTPDWAKDAERKAIGEVPGYVLRTVAHGDYAEGERADEWDETTGKRKVERPVPEPTEEQKAQAEIGELMAYLASTDWYVNRYAETGKEIPIEVSEKRSYCRDRISEIRFGK